MSLINAGLPVVLAGNQAGGRRSDPRTFANIPPQLPGCAAQGHASNEGPASRSVLALITRHWTMPCCANVDLCYRGPCSKAWRSSAKSSRHWTG